MDIWLVIYITFNALLIGFVIGFRLADKGIKESVDFWKNHYMETNRQLVETLKSQRKTKQDCSEFGENLVIEIAKNGKTRDAIKRLVD